MRKIFSLVPIVISLGLSSIALGQPNIDPEADRILKSVQSYMSGLNSLLIQAELTDESVYDDAHKLQFGGTLELGMRSSGQFFAVNHTTLENRRMYVADGTFTVFDEDVNVYVQAPASGSLREVFARLHAKHGISAPGGELFSGNAYELLVQNASKVIYVGVSNINGTACNHVAGILQDMDWQLWVRKEGDPELCKYLVTDRDIPMAPQFSITFTKWQANAAISDQQFKFQAPADAEAIEFVK